MNEKATIERNEIENIQPSSVYLMPEGLPDPLSDDEEYDLIAYLVTSSQP